MYIKLLALIAIIATMSSAAMAGMLNMSPVYADKSNPCIDNGDKSCQHFNNGNDEFVGGPHYPCCGGEEKGNPHGQSIYNPEKGNPHCGAEEGCIKP